ncbi:MAG: HAMP domain-containing sensor histidine kinase [Filomicrobium sp.]
MPANSVMDRMVRLNAITVAIVTVPLLVIIVMAIKTILSDKAASKARAVDAARQLAKSHAFQIISKTDAVVAQQHEQTRKILSGITDYVSILRRAVHELSPPFVALFEDGRRVFPPEENAMLLIQERQMLNQFGTALRAALEKTGADERGAAWATFQGTPTLLTCEQIEPPRALCIATRLDDVQRILDEVLADPSTLSVNSTELIDPWGRRQWPLASEEFGAEQAAIYELSNTFRNWTIRVGVDTSSTSTTPLILAISIPVIVGWGLALIALIRFQSESARQNQMRADSAARLSHDLRTPIANLAIYVELIARHGRDNAAISRCCSALETEIGRLADIADNTLRRSRGLPQKRETGPAVVLDDVVQSTLSRYEPLLLKSGCTLKLDTQASEVAVEDRPALERILINLIDNARSHAAGANVEIATRKTNSGVLLLMTDDGPQPTAVNGGVKEGHGLGLKVVEELAHSRGGSFKALIGSDGSRFEVLLPAAGTEKN